MGCLLMSETWRSNKAEILERQQGHIFMGAGEFENKHGVGIFVNKSGENVTSGQNTSTNEPQQRRSLSTNNVNC